MQLTRDYSSHLLVVVEKIQGPMVFLVGSEFSSTVLCFTCVRSRTDV